MPRIRIRNEDFITDIEGSLKTFKTNVVTPEISSSSANEEEEPEDIEDKAVISKKGQKRGRPAKKAVRRPARIKRTVSSISNSSNGLDPKELQQLAKFMLSSSEEEGDESGSESDDEYRSRAHFDSDVERRQTRSPGAAPRSIEKKKSPKKETKREEHRRPAKRSLESVLKRVNDMKKTSTAEELIPPKVTKKQRKQSATLEKFFAAEKEMDLAKTEVKKEQKKAER